MAQSTPRPPQNRGPKSTGPAKKAAAPVASNGKPTAGAGPARKSPAKGKSIVNQRQRPWGLIITTIAIAVLALGVVGYAAIHKSSKAATANGYTNPEIADALAIPGVSYKAQASHTHVEGNINYKNSPPIGGNHSQYWADCSGTVYPNAIANENAVHMLEHGAVWITYKPGLAASQVATLSKLVTGVDRMAMSPYPNLKTAISLQAWDYQLFVDSASDPRIEKFILALRFNPKTTPEATASCGQPTFITHPSTFGHPLWTPTSA